MITFPDISGELAIIAIMLLGYIVILAMTANEQKRKNDER